MDKNVDVFRLLSHHGQRATYSAVAGFLGTEARTLMWGSPRTRMNSWVVNAKTGLPTGYRVADLDPRLLDSDRVIASPQELADWVRTHPLPQEIPLSTLAVRISGSTVHIGPFYFTIERTLRLPQDGKDYDLPPSLGSFPLHKVDDFADKVPPAWREHGGVFFPMWQREAAWINFTAPYDDPVAVRVAAGKVCAVTGKPWSDGLGNSPQDYMVVGGPDGQRWLDGFKIADGIVGQFVAMPMGMGYTVEKQVTGKEDVGGIQLAVYSCRPERKPARPAISGILRSAGMYGSSEKISAQSEKTLCASPSRGGGVRGQSLGAFNASDFGSPEMTKGAEMGLAAGGRMKQAVKKDAIGFDAWVQPAGGRVFVHIVNCQMYEAITGRKAPATPISAKTYSDHGFPWYSTYNEDQGKDVSAQPALAGVKNVAQLDKEKGIEGQQDDTSVVVKPDQVKHIGDPGAIRDGKW